MRTRRVAAALASALVLAGCTATATPSSTVSVPAAVERTRVAVPTPTVMADPLPGRAVDALLIGTDSRDPQSLTGNADTIMLLHVPADRQALYLVSFTRDMWVPIPGLGEGKINSAFARGGTSTLVDTVSAMLGGLQVDYVAQTNFAGFIAITRALDGFEVDNQHPSTVTVQSTGRVVDFPAGRITLSGTDGLIYVRERKQPLPLGDLDRTERQRAAVIGIMDKIAESADQPSVLAELVPMLIRNVKITGDLGPGDILGLVPLAAHLTRDDVVGLMVPITGFGSRGGASVNLVDEPQTAALGDALRADAVEEYVAQYGTGYAP